MRLFKQPPVLQNISLVSVKNKIKMNSLFNQLPPIIYTPILNRNPTKLVTKVIIKPPVLHKTITSTYRLGDLVLLYLSEEEKKEILTDHPNSIGSKYIVEKNKNTHIQNIDLFSKILSILTLMKESNNISSEVFGLYFSTQGNLMLPYFGSLVDFILTKPLNII